MRIAAPKKYIAPMEVAIKSFQYNRKNIAFLNWISNYCGNSCCEIRVSSKWNQNNQFFIANQKYTSRQMFVSGRGENSKSQGYTGFSYFFMKLWYFFMKLSGFFYETIENCNNILVNLRRQAHVFQLWWICAEVCWIWAKKKNIFFFLQLWNCDQFHFFLMKLETLSVCITFL